jgi:hypothetical protein
VSRIDLDRSIFSRLRADGQPRTPKFEIRVGSGPKKNNRWREDNYDLDDEKHTSRPPSPASVFLVAALIFPHKKTRLDAIQSRAMLKPIEVVTG